MRGAYLAIPAQHITVFLVRLHDRRVASQSKLRYEELKSDASMLSGGVTVRMIFGGSLVHS